MNPKTTELLIIDPQNDFCDLPDAMRDGNTPALPVAGAHTDMLRLAGLIRLGGQGLSGITVTLDSHQRLDIAHPGFWVRADGRPIALYSQIRAADVESGEILPRDEAVKGRVLAYLEALEHGGRYAHTVWPVHCELGAWGHNVHGAVRSAYNRWEGERGIGVEKVLKGMDPWTEHYSAIRAEVPIPDAPETLVNNALLNRLAQADQILLAGEASSHCVKATAEHIVEYRPELAARLVVLSDCMSPVGGFEAAQEAFFEAMRSAGARIARSTEILPELRAE